MPSPKSLFLKKIYPGTIDVTNIAPLFDITKLTFLYIFDYFQKLVLRFLINEANAIKFYDEP